MRNPYRFAMRPGTSEIWAGDVGAGGHGRRSTGSRTSPTPAKAVQLRLALLREHDPPPAGFPSKDLDLCREPLHRHDESGPTSPYFAYKHLATQMNGNDTCNVNDGASISGIAFYTKRRPVTRAQYGAALFFGDYTRNCLWVIRAQAANGLPDPTKLESFATPAVDPLDPENPVLTGPVDLVTGPNGDLFYPSLNDGTIRRIQYFATNRPPVAVVTALPDRR